MLTFVMLYTVAVAAPIAVGAWAIAAILRRYGRPERGVWLAGLALSVAVPAAMLLSRSGAALPVQEPAVETGVLGLPDLIAVSEEAATIGLDAYVIALWALVTGLLLARWAVGAYRLERESRTWPTRSIDGVEVTVTEDVGPAVAGIFQPRILAPAWIAHLPDSKRVLVLTHEQEHVRAADPVVVALARLTRALLPWNPVVWFLTSRLVRAVELDCDRRVLRHSTDVRAYGNTLLDLSARRSSRLVGAAAFAEEEVPLRNRILAMTTPPRTVSVAAIFSSVVLGVVLLVGALQIPVPTIRIQLEIGPASIARPAALEPAAQPEPPAQPFRPSSTRPQLINEEEVQADARRELEEAVRQDPRILEDDRNRPHFTPVSYEPVMINRDEVAEELLATYPRYLRDQGFGGTTVLQLRVGTDGRVLDRVVERSSGYPDLDEAALRVVDMMRFEPARNRDQRVPVWVSQRATFVPVARDARVTDHHTVR